MITKRQILSLIALSIIMVIISMACKRKPTDVGSLYVVEEAKQTPAPEFPSDSPNDKLTIDTNQGLIVSNDGTDIIDGEISEIETKVGSHSKKLELVGKWKMYSYTESFQSVFTVDIDGNINFRCGGIFYGLGNDYYTYSGKVSDTFDYPYSTKLTATYRGAEVEGIITFDSPSSATIFYSYYYSSGIGWKSGWNKETSTFKIKEALN